jgi:hypothetical protein
LDATVEEVAKSDGEDRDAVQGMLDAHCQQRLGLLIAAGELPSADECRDDRLKRCRTADGRS